MGQPSGWGAFTAVTATALLTEVKHLAEVEDAGVQILAATHSPLVMLSVEPIFNLMLGQLKKLGLETMNLHEQPFDPNLAEAVLHEPGDGGARLAIAPGINIGRAIAANGSGNGLSVDFAKTGKQIGRAHV